MKLIATFSLAAAAIVMAFPASAQFAKNEDAVKYRQSAFFVMGQHFGRIGAMVNGKIPFDAKVATENAEIVAEMAKLPWAGFVAGAESPKSLPDIWKDAAKFKEHGDKLISESAKLVVAAKVGNLDTLKTAFGATAGTCKACHDAFRPK